MQRSRFNTLRFWLKVIFLIASVLILIAVSQKLNISVRFSNLLQSTLLWVKMLGTMGAIAFIVIYNLATILFVPASILTLGGGAIYGVVWGSIYVFVAATLGAIFAFLIGRYFARGWFFPFQYAELRFWGYPRGFEGLHFRLNWHDSRHNYVCLSGFSHWRCCLTGNPSD